MQLTWRMLPINCASMGSRYSSPPVIGFKVLAQFSQRAIARRVAHQARQASVGRLYRCIAVGVDGAVEKLLQFRPRCDAAVDRHEVVITQPGG